ncbi:MAG: B12-binding domain-containing radical SAM protein [Candidatus Altiarchaeota archaeon]|nr:B12-binding domain-containing radical SAM protein [Candidatus Altiarchaeota archaeon]
MYKILLLNPPAECGYVKEGRCQHKAAVFSTVYPPMTLAYMASLLRDKSDVKLLDAIGLDMSLEDVLKSIIDFKPDYIICNTTTPTFKNDIVVFREIKGHHSCKIVVYGVHVTALWREALECDFIDAVVIGEPEITVSELAEKEIRQIDGIAYKIHGKIVKNKERGFMDLDSLPIPAWDIVDLSRYRVPVTGEKYVLLTTGRGCPYNCSFCVSQSYYGLKYRKRSISKIIDEILSAKKLGVENFFLFAETFTLDKQYVSNLCDELLSRRISIKWVCNSRVDTVDEDVLSKMKQAGCWMISFGIESSSQDILDSCNKGIVVGQVESAVEMANKIGLVVVGHFIFGLPGEDSKSALNTLDFSLNLPLTFAEYYIFTPFPGSLLFEQFKDKVGDDWATFEYSQNIVSTTIDLQSIRKKAYMSFYLRPKIMLKILSVFGLKRLHSLIISGVKFVLNI